MSEHQEAHATWLRFALALILIVIGSVGACAGVVSAWVLVAWLGRKILH